LSGRFTEEEESVLEAGAISGTLGIAIAKNVFQLHGVSRSGHVVLKRRVMRDA
jgi:hypothetical protein